MKERYFAVCDCEEVKDLGEHDDIHGAFEVEPYNTNFVLSETGIKALRDNINEALEAK